MASFYAELVVAGTTYPIRYCEFGFTQATSARGRVQAKTRHGLLHLTLDVPHNDQLLAWATTPHKPQAGQVTFFNTSPRTALETLSFAAGECVAYRETFVAGDNQQGAYVCEITIASEKLVLTPGGPTASPAGAVAAPVVTAAAVAPAPGAAALAAVPIGGAGRSVTKPNPAGSGKAQVLAYAGFGGDIVTKADRTTTVLGKFQDPVLPGTGTSEVLKMPEGTFTRGAENLGGLNILDIPTEKYEKLLETYGEEQGKELFWQEHNQPFLDKAFADNHEVRLLSDPQDARNRTGFYERELHEIEGTTDAAGQRSQGLAEKYDYQYNPATATYAKATPRPAPNGPPPLAAKLPSPAKIRSRL